MMSISQWTPRSEPAAELQCLRLTGKQTRLRAAGDWEEQWFLSLEESGVISVYEVSTGFCSHCSGLLCFE